MLIEEQSGADGEEPDEDGVLPDEDDGGAKKPPARKRLILTMSSRGLSPGSSLSARVWHLAASWIPATVPGCRFSRCREAVESAAGA